LLHFLLYNQRLVIFLHPSRLLSAKSVRIPQLLDSKERDFQER
jgi:hypothetical protein